MCGRYSLFTSPGEIASRFDATFDHEFEPRYNAAPSQRLPVIASDSPDTIRRMEWGLVPSWADDRGEFGFINARAETVAEKPSFGDAFERRRCLVLADGFYEWAEDGQPYRVTLADGRPFAMAGLWERWTPPDRQAGLGDFAGGRPDDPEPVETFTVVTTEPNALVAELHDRMSVILAREDERRWLHGDTEAAARLLDPYPAEEMRADPVSTAVNDPATDSPAVLGGTEAGF